MPKKDNTSPNKPDNPPSNEAHNKGFQSTVDQKPISPRNQSPADDANKKQAQVQNRKKPILAQPGNRTPKKKLVFANPISHQRIYERPPAPDNEQEQRPRSLSKTMGKGHPTIADLEPPLNLVASLDMAAKKLNARNSTLGHKSTASTNSQTLSATSQSNLATHQSSKSVDHTSNQTSTSSRKH